MGIVIYKQNGIYCTTTEENYAAGIQNARLVQKWQDFNSSDGIIAYCCKYWSCKPEDFTTKGFVYLTHYKEYPIYEPAEGGYYYAGREANEAYECGSVAEAIQQMKEIASNLEDEGFVILDDFTQAFLHSKYVGESEAWIIEETYGSRNSGKQIYQ